ncbi:MAG: hypothetical protein HY815_08030 [Candidatus Riflebacteria bacterium]|nr:hypothetical protein [Candidatus Riflebacteria bacterium]
MTQHARHGAAVEQVRGVDRQQPEAVVVVVDMELQIEPGRLDLDLQELERDARGGDRMLGPGLEGEGDLEERVPRQLPLRLQRLHQPFERHLLMGVGAEADVPDPTDQLVEPGVAGEIAPEHHVGHEETDQRLQLGPVTTRDRRAHDDVVLPRVPG